ncbi:RNA polymerase sigma factor [Marinoscillum sp.]|uniref:RNA polymerase sigma factor n=1 Tax=Marinoscillum sp. TaxID=2024838 RepID=UPI003BAB8382
MTSNKPSGLVDHFFRNEFGKTVSLLTARFGTHHLELAEDSVQEALIQAMNSWRTGKIPENPSGWIFRVANNKMIDQLRRSQKVFYATQVPEETYETPLPADDQGTDDMIRMMFACCNPKLSTEYQIILTLKILGGLSIREISLALLKKEETVAKAYTRAKKQFKAENIRLELPNEHHIKDRINTVLKVIYLLFNEGYKSSEGDQLIRKDLCEEALRLNQLLLAKELTNTDSARSLIALIHFQSARFEARVDALGNSISLEHQDRSRWDARHIDLGNRYLSSVENGERYTYFVQAAINGIHCDADDYQSTNWSYILTLYNHLYSISPNPIVALNRIYPIAMVHGPEEALNALQPLKTETSLRANHLLPATEAELYVQLRETEQAIASLKNAIQLCSNDRDREFYQRKIKRLEVD